MRGKRAYSDGAVKQDILDYMRANPDAKKKEYVVGLRLRSIGMSVGKN